MNSARRCDTPQIQEPLHNGAAVVTQTTAAATALPDLTTHWVGFASLVIFAIAYILVIAEEAIHLRKSKPVIIAAGILWIMIAAVYATLGLPDQAEPALRHVLLEYVGLMLFLLVAMTYVNAIEER